LGVEGSDKSKGRGHVGSYAAKNQKGYTVIGMIAVIVYPLLFIFHDSKD